MANLTAERAREVLRYNPETGALTWKKTLSNVAQAGTLAGSFNKSEGRISLGIDGGKYRAHRIIWLMMKGEMPAEVDHINGDGMDNRWCNLRLTSHAENMRNRKVCSNNKSRIMGVCWNKPNQKWRARIKVMENYLSLGCFSDFFEACCARKSAENKMGFHVNHGRVV